MGILKKNIYISTKPKILSLFLKDYYFCYFLFYFISCLTLVTSSLKSYIVICYVEFDLVY